MGPGDILGERDDSVVGSLPSVDTGTTLVGNCNGFSRGIARLFISS